MGAASAQYVSRAGDKLHAALEAFGLDVRGAVCADFGCNVGGFTDCLLQHGARRVYAVDTGYGTLAWTLRRDGRVVCMERTNALHAPAPEPVDLVTIDTGWTVQQHIVPAAVRWLRRDAAGRPTGRILSLLKPHYELTKLQQHKPAAPLDLTEARRVCRDVCERLAELGAAPVAVMQSALLGKGGNVEFLLLLDFARSSR
jgi:23S rRNA (cytidine1920-2'-O)/16S rRNA (cytidine1409-2'-O)-methyltransferase